MGSLDTYLSTWAALSLPYTNPNLWVAFLSPNELTPDTFCPHVVSIPNFQADKL